MSDACRRYERFLARGAEAAAVEEAAWREHLAACASCRAQAAADEALRGALAAEPPALAAGFETRLRRRLGERAVSRRPRHSGRIGRWLLAAYGSGAALASLLVLSRLPWESLPGAPILGLAATAGALLSPLVLLDRIGIVRPPGGG